MNRLLVENIVLAGDLVSGYHKKQGPKRITIKVDIAKAFDTLSWEFLFNCLAGLQLPEVMLRRLRACVCTTSFMLGYNGTVQGDFKGKRGLRQGDPLSPYLFVIAMNVLSVMLNKAAAEMKIKYHAKCSSSKLTHLCFADDILMFIDGSLSSVQNALQVLREFELRSGLAVSVQKSSFFASGMSQQELDTIKASTGMPHASLPVRYLDVPLTTKKLSIHDCEVLIQQVKGSVWVAWFRSEVLDGNLSNYWTVKTNPRFSWLVNKLIKMREVVFTWIKVQVENGRNCRFRTDNWSPYGSLEHFLLRGTGSRFGIAKTATLSDLHMEGQWALPPARSDEFLQVQIYLTTLHITEEEDRHEWVLTGSPSTRYITGEVYKKLRGEEEEVSWAGIVWTSGSIPKHSFLTWLFILNRCPTRDRLIQWGFRTDSACLLCNGDVESRDHIFFLCPYTWELWKTVSGRCGIIPARAWNDSVDQMKNLAGNRLRKRLTCIACQATIYWIWSERNNRLHRRQFRSSDGIFRLLDRQIRDKILSFRQQSPANASKLMQMWL
ncbi:uncharacterized protein LOC106448660 [Brassica napus]|uniref:uncharacterized protein LOC106448660 n=1 Tax=Brassica napus TaxID=3708 RepID=UPI0020795211|nr:uncharacterized protein LOC106448660 [Brassica napus]